MNDEIDREFTFAEKTLLTMSCLTISFGKQVLQSDEDCHCFDHLCVSEL